MLDDDFKKRVSSALQNTAQCILSDIEDGMIPRGGTRRRTAIAELVLDADRPVTLGRMTQDDYDKLCDAYFHKEDRHTRRWLHELLNY